MYEQERESRQAQESEAERKADQRPHSLNKNPASRGFFVGLFAEHDAPEIELVLVEFHRPAVFLAHRLDG
jgi:hypothetical protein